jgi:DNA-binding transcriptional ArsR family regulator
MMPLILTKELPMQALDDRAFAFVAEYFQALAEPTRLKLLHALQDGEKRVGELTDITGCTQANVSKHLSLLAKIGLVRREARGTSVYYTVADPSIYSMCELVCGQVATKLKTEVEVSGLFTPR